MSWKCITSEKILSNRWLSVYKDKVELPNGIMIEDFFRIRVSSAAAVVPITKDNYIVLKKEYRYCYNEDLIEIPSGVFEPDEQDAVLVARRELREETGYESNDWEYLGATIENSAKLTNYIHLYLARDCYRTSNQQLDSTEDINVVLLPIKEAVEMVMDSRIVCNCTAHAILKAARIIGI